jgi:hypothetical protein
MQGPLIKAEIGAPQRRPIQGSGSSIPSSQLSVPQMRSKANPCSTSPLSLATAPRRGRSLPPEHPHGRSGAPKSTSAVPVTRALKNLEDIAKNQK